MCYMHVGYAADRESATVTAKCRQHDSVTKVEYNYADQCFTDSDTFEVSSKTFTDKEGDLTLTVRATDDKGEQY